MLSEPHVVHRVWRSQLLLVLAVLVSAVHTVVLSRSVPATVMYGELLRWGETRLMLYLPLWWLVPCSLAVVAIARMYDVRYVLDMKGISAFDGVFQLQQRITRVEYVDIRSVEARQSLWERLLNIGVVEVGTAASQGMEIRMSGIHDPLSLKRFILECRDKQARVSGTVMDSQVAA